MNEMLFFYGVFWFLFFSLKSRTHCLQKLAQALRGKSKFLNGKRVRCDDKEGMEQTVKRLIN